MSVENLAAYIDHTLLKPEATHNDVRALVAEAVRLGVHAVCISPTMLPIDLPRGSRLQVAVVCGFPSGAHASSVKAAEAALAVAGGADEVDMVIDLAGLREGRLSDVVADIRAVRIAVPAPRLLKVIIEAAVLEDEEIVAACQAAEEAGADFVKTSTGFHRAGGASVHAVRLMAEAVGGRLGVKASGGIHSRDDAEAMIDAGATRIGVSATRAVLSENPGSPDLASREGQPGGC